MCYPIFVFRLHIFAFDPEVVLKSSRASLGNKRMNMGMEVKQAAMGLQAEDPATHVGAELQAFTKVFLPGLPCAAKQ